MTRESPAAFAAFIGLDWADAKHDVCLQVTGSARREFLGLEHRPDAIDVWAQNLRPRFNGQPVAVCLELNKGPIVSALRKYDFFVLFPVNPLTVAKYREAFTPSRAKDDPTDAALQVELLLKLRDKLTPLSPQSPAMRALEQLVAHRRRLVGDKVRLTNRPQLPPVPRPSPQGTPAALPYPILRRLASTSQSRAAPRWVRRKRRGHGVAAGGGRWGGRGRGRRKKAFCFSYPPTIA